MHRLADVPFTEKVISEGLAIGESIGLSSTAIAVCKPFLCEAGEAMLGKQERLFDKAAHAVIDFKLIEELLDAYQSEGVDSPSSVAEYLELTRASLWVRLEWLGLTHLMLKDANVTSASLAAQSRPFIYRAAVAHRIYSAMYGMRYALRDVRVLVKEHFELWAPSV